MIKQMKKEDYMYCEDCETYVDLWKYGDFENTGHKDCKWRFVNEEELKECIKDCIEDGCFEEDDGNKDDKESCEHEWETDRNTMPIYKLAGLGETVEKEVFCSKCGKKGREVWIYSTTIEADTDA